MPRIAPVVLFADRDIRWTRPLRSELRRRGARPMTAGSLDELSRLSTRFAPDLIVFDDDLAPPDSDPAAILRRSCPRAKLIRIISRCARPADVPDSPVLAVTRHKVAEAIEHALPGRLGDPVAPQRAQPLVLCVDDDAFFLNALARLLKRHGCRVAGFEDPEGALESLPELSPDLAILDLTMPGMDGLDLADEIRLAHGERIPIVMLTARGSDGDIVGGYRHGASYYITKPCAPRTVLNIVDYLVGDLDTREREMLEAEL